MRAGVRSDYSGQRRGREENLRAQGNKNDEAACQTSPLPLSLVDKVRHTVASRTDRLSQNIRTTQQMLQ
jgi:hypothetical protein